MRVFQKECLDNGILLSTKEEASCMGKTENCPLQAEPGVREIAV